MLYIVNIKLLSLSMLSYSTEGKKHVVHCIVEEKAPCVSQVTGVTCWLNKWGGGMLARDTEHPRQTPHPQPQRAWRS